MSKIVATPFLICAALLIPASTLAFSTPASADPHSAAYSTPMVHPVNGAQDLEGIACNESNSCIAVGYVSTTTAPYSEGVVVPIVDGVPGSAEPVAGTTRLTGVACPSPSTCLAVGDQAVSYMGSNPIFSVGEAVTITNGIPGAPQEAFPGPDPWLSSPNELFLLGVSCTGISSCVAVGMDIAYWGVIVPIKDGEPSPEEPVGGSEATFVYGVACSTNCYAVGSWNTNGHGGDVLVTIAHRRLVSVAQYPEKFDLVAIACYGKSNSCMAVGRTKTVGALFPIRSTIEETSMGGVNPVAITCRSATYCVAVGSDSSDGAIVRITNEFPGTAQLVPGVQLDGVACSGTKECLAVGSNSSGGAIVRFGLPT